MNFQQLIVSRDLPIEDRVLQVIDGCLKERGIEISDGDRQDIEHRVEEAFKEGERGVGSRGTTRSSRKRANGANSQEA